MPKKYEIKKKTEKKVYKNRRTNFENVVDISYVDSTDADNDNYCAICELYYYDKKGSKCDWVKTTCCKKWIHEDCVKIRDCLVCKK